MEHLLELYRSSSQKPRIGGENRNRKVAGATQLLTSLFSQCVLGSFFYLHWGAVFSNICICSFNVAAMVWCSLGLLVQGNRKTTYYSFVTNPTLCSFPTYAPGNIMWLVYFESNIQPLSNPEGAGLCGTNMAAGAFVFLPFFSFKVCECLSYKVTGATKKFALCLNRNAVDVN